MIKILKVKYPCGFWMNGYQYWKIGNIFIGIKDSWLQNKIIEIRNRIMRYI